MGEKIIIVDEEDNIIGHKKRSEKRKEDISRASSLWIENSKGEILLAQRSYTRKFSPGKWGPAAAGTIEEGETYDSNIIKEAKEEIGLTGIQAKKADKVRIIDGKSNFFGQRYEAQVDWPIEQFKMQKEEVEAIKWFTKEELQKLVKEKPEDFLSIVHEKVKK